MKEQSTKPIVPTTTQKQLIQLEFGMEHPTIWKLIDGMREVQKGRYIYFEQLVAGHKPLTKLKKYREADGRLLTIVNKFTDRNILEYLRGTAHNYTVNS